MRLLRRSMQAPDSRGTFRFSDFELDVAAYALRRQGRQVKIERQPMDVLILLIESRPQLVSRADIVNRLWGSNVFVDVETGVNTAISKVRQALRDVSDAPMFVETVPGKGYRFVAAVEVAFVEQAPKRASPAAREGLPEPPRHNLPSELTSFIGRRRELAELPGAARVFAPAVAHGRRWRRQDAARGAPRGGPRRRTSRTACGWSIWRPSRRPIWWRRRSRPSSVSERARSDRSATRSSRSCAIVSSCSCWITAST